MLGHEKEKQLSRKIKRMQEKLDKTIARGSNCSDKLTESKLVELSQEIDKLIVNYYLNSDSE